MIPYSLYLHIPFCVHRCAYCDFNTYAGLEGLIPAYSAAVCAELEAVAGAAGGRLPLHTIFFGGGTPSLLPLPQIELILAAIHSHYDVLARAEITLEANPGTLSQAFLQGLHRLGVSRLSLGMQSANPFELQMLERQHDFQAVASAVRIARRSGFDNLNLDLIFGLPGQALETWERSLRLAHGLEPEHLSLYALSVEHGTPLGHWVERGLVQEPDADAAADMYERASELLDGWGYRQYEISNWARPNGDGGLRSCRHNLQYWRAQPYLGVGAGAHGYAANLRVANVLSPQIYVQRLTSSTAAAGSGAARPVFPRSPATASAVPSSGRVEMGEVMMMGLRLTQEGVSRTAFRQRFGQELDQVYRTPIGQLVSQGLLEWSGDSLRLTRRGRLLGNRVFAEFI